MAYKRKVSQTKKKAVGKRAKPSKTMESESGEDDSQFSLVEIDEVASVGKASGTETKQQKIVVESDSKDEDDVKMKRSRKKETAAVESEDEDEDDRKRKRAKKKKTSAVESEDEDEDDIKRKRAKKKKTAAVESEDEDEDDIKRKRVKKKKTAAVESDDDERRKSKKKPNTIECIAIRLKVEDEMHPNFHLHNRLDKVALDEIIWPGEKKLKKGENIEVVYNDFPTAATIDNSYVFSIDIKNVRRFIDFCCLTFKNSEFSRRKKWRFFLPSIKKSTNRMKKTSI
jgi:hypothetical protein